MEAINVHKGVSTRSQLYDSLKFYLNNKNRLQPIIGLCSIVECVTTGSHDNEALYLCEVCVCRLSKADVRNHIMGSLHRFNYVKTRHPSLVSEWKDHFDPSKMAWPLMERAKTIEEKEGPGEVQLLEVDDALYQRMSTHSENDAITLLNMLRNGREEDQPVDVSESSAVLHYPVKSERLVLLSHNQQKHSTESTKTSAEVQKVQDNTLKMPKASVPSENSNSFFDDYTEAEPLIGLFRVDEIRSEDGDTYCFLCHCCRVRCNKKDIIKHLTNSSHLRNYFMEIHPELGQMIKIEDINANPQLLQWLAKKVEQEEGRGELKVVNAPQSLCNLMTDKSYHWCVKMLHNGWTDTQKGKMAVKGPSPNKTLNEVILQKCAKMVSKKKKKKKMRDTSTPVFQVSLPITRSSVLLLQRTSFSRDSLSLASERSPTSASDLSCVPEDSELVNDTGPCRDNNESHASVSTTSPPQQDLCCEDAGQYMGQKKNLNITLYQDVDRYIRDSAYLNQSEDVNGTKDQMFTREQHYNRHQGYEETSRERFCTEWQNEATPPAVPHTQDWSSYNPNYGHRQGFIQQWYNPTSYDNTCTRVQVPREEQRREMNSVTAQHYCQQQPQHQYMAQHIGVGQQYWSDDSATPLGAAQISNHSPWDPPAHSGSFSTAEFLELQQRRWQTYTEVTIGQTTPQDHMTFPTTYQGTYSTGHEVMSYPGYNTRPHPDFNFRATGATWSNLNMN